MNKLSKGMEDLHRDPKRIREEALKLIDIISTYDIDRMSPADRNFFESIYNKLERCDYTNNFFVSEKQVTWLRDIKDKYL